MPGRRRGRAPPRRASAWTTRAASRSAWAAPASRRRQVVAACARAERGMGRLRSPRRGPAGLRRHPRRPRCGGGRRARGPPAGPPRRHAGPRRHRGLRSGAPGAADRAAAAPAAPGGPRQRGPGERARPPGGARSRAHRRQRGHEVGEHRGDDGQPPGPPGLDGARAWARATCGGGARPRTRGRATSWCWRAASGSRPCRSPPTSAGASPS